MSKVWLITGSASGLGRNLAEVAGRWLEVSRAADYSAPVELPTFPSH